MFKNNNNNKKEIMKKYNQKTLDEVRNLIIKAKSYNNSVNKENLTDKDLIHFLDGFKNAVESVNFVKSHNKLESMKVSK